ncbi:MAG: tetratricopeptide repeat protein, partial [Rickettsiales bacterium]
LESTPSGIDSPKVIAKTPPVKIKRVDPGVGKLPEIDYRAHEELHLKIEVRRPDPSIHDYLEQAYENLMAGKMEIAIGYYKEALDLDPNSELALFGLATTYHKNNQLDEARDLYGRLLEIDPYHREGLNNFLALVSQESPGEAIRELEAMEAKSPDFSPIPAQLGVIYNKLGDHATAAQKLARAIELSPENLAYRYNLAVTLDKLGKSREAADLYMELVNDYQNGATLPGDVDTIRERAIFLSSKG